MAFQEPIMQPGIGADPMLDPTVNPMMPVMPAPDEKLEAALVASLKAFNPPEIYYASVNNSVTEAVSIYNDGLSPAVKELKKKQKNRSFVPLYWFATATDSTWKQAIAVLLPKGSKVFEISSTSESDDAPTALVQEMMEYLMKKGGLRSQMVNDIKEACIRGAMGCTLDWDTRYPYGTRLRHLSIPAQSMAISGRMDRLTECTIVYRHWLTKSQVQGFMTQVDADGAPVYRRLDKVLASEPLSQNSQEYRSSGWPARKDRQYYEAFTYYIPDFEHNGVHVPYLVATVIGKTLVRFEPLDHPPDLLPFFVMLVNPRFDEELGPYSIGQPACARGLDMDVAAMTYFSGGLDGFKRSIYPRRKFDQSEEANGTLTREEFNGSGPGASLPVSTGARPDHLTVVDEPDRGIYGMQALMHYLGWEFSRMTGAAGFTAGSPDNNNQRVTNLSKRMEAQSSDISLRDMAEHVSDCYLGPYVRYMYHLVSEALRAMFRDTQAYPELLKLSRDVFGPERFDRLLASASNNPLLVAEAIPSVDAVTLRMADYESALDQEEQGQKVAQGLQLTQQLAQSGIPVMQFINIPELVRTAYNLLNLGDNILLPSPNPMAMQGAMPGDPQQQPYPPADVAGRPPYPATDGASGSNGPTGPATPGFNPGEPGF